MIVAGWGACLNSGRVCQPSVPRPNRIMLVKIGREIAREKEGKTKKKEERRSGGKDKRQKTGRRQKGKEERKKNEGGGAGGGEGGGLERVLEERAELDARLRYEEEVRTGCRVCRFARNIAP